MHEEWWYNYLLVCHTGIQKTKPLEDNKEKQNLMPFNVRYNTS